MAEAPPERPSSLVVTGKHMLRRLAHLASPSLEARIDDYRVLRERTRTREDFQWVPLPRCPDVRLDAAAVTIGHHMHVFGGYARYDAVLDAVDVLDMKTARWKARLATPSGLAQSHVAVAADGERYVYLVSGQLGPHCLPATPRGFVFDSVGAAWTELPPLPAPRYAATAGIWRGRLHVMGGSKEDRHTPAQEHWSLAVDAGRALDSGWRVEAPLPIGGPHRATAVLRGRLFVFGGQQGDWIGIDREYRCVAPPTVERHYADTFALALDGSCWDPMSPMPLAVSHTESSVVKIGDVVYLFGGQCALPDGSELAVSAAVQRYDAALDSWTIVGTLPYGVKTLLAGYYDGHVFAVGGQRDRSASDPRPWPVVDHTWRAPLKGL